MKMKKMKYPKKSIWKDKASWQLLLLCLPALIGYTLFNYVPITVSLAIPFKDYKFSRGILGSEWIGLQNFEWMFSTSAIIRAVKNTFLYGLWFMFIGSVVNVIVA